MLLELVKNVDTLVLFTTTLTMKSRHEKLIYLRHGASRLKLVKKNIKKANKFQSFFIQKNPRLYVAPVDKNYFIESSNLLSLSRPLSYNLKIETQTQVERVCDNTMQIIINHVEESINCNSYNPYLNVIICKQTLFKNNCFFKI